jgi:hypothetical protein
MIMSDFHWSENLQHLLGILFITIGREQWMLDLEIALPSKWQIQRITPLSSDFHL